MADKSTKQPIAFDRFFLFKGFNAGFTLLLMGIPYGIVVTYIAIYGKELGITTGVGLFFSFMAVGMIFSRLISGKLVDKGKLLHVITYGTALCVVTFFILSALHFLENKTVISALFFLVSLLLGIGYGLIFPAYNTLFVNLAPNNRRATASSTYMTSWDIGVGIGLLTGGWLADITGSLQSAYFAGGSASAISVIYFVKVAAPHFKKNRLR
jgi:MFS family permease